MKFLILATAALGIVAAVSCAKKDDGGGPQGIACAAPGLQVPSPAFGRCLDQGQCPMGTGQSLTEPSMCVDLRTGQNVSVQQCGVGYWLTANGCRKQATCPQGRALDGENCIEALAAGGAPQTQSYGQPMYNQGGGYLPNQPIGGFGQYGQPGGFGGFPQQPVYPYRPF